MPLISDSTPPPTPNDRVVGNAIKFTSQGEVVLSVKMQERKTDAVLLHFAVRDTGIGTHSTFLCGHVLSDQPTNQPIASSPAYIIY